MKETEVIDRIINAMDEAEAAVGLNQFEGAELWIKVASKWVEFYKELDLSQEGDEVEAEGDDEDSYEDLETLWDVSEDDDEDVVAQGANGHGATVAAVEDDDEDDDGFGDDPDDVRRLGPVEPLS